MRYPPEHKASTRERILRSAARLFRRRGYDGVGIDEIMADAGLTRGGFYAHFRSKDALFAAVLGEEEPDFTRRLRARRGRTAAEAMGGALAVIDGYLATANREKVGLGCSMAALAAEVGRARGPARAAFADLVRGLAAELAAHMPAGGGDREARALATIVLCAGGLTFARAVGDDALSRRILRACRDRAAAEIGGGRARGRRPRRAS